MMRSLFSNLDALYSKQRNKQLIKSSDVKNETRMVECAYHFADWFGFHSQFSEVVIESGISPASSSGQESQQYIHHVQRVTELVNLHQIREDVLLGLAGELHLVETQGNIQ